MEPIDPTEHLKDLNLRQKASLAMAVANQKRYDDLRAEYRKELDALEAKYKQLERPIWEDRCKIVAGEAPLDQLKVEEDKLAEMKDQEAHIPNFWFHVLRNNDTIRALSGLSDADKEAMSYITDVVCEPIPLTEEEIEVEDDDECCCHDPECKCKEDKMEGEGEEKEKEKHKITVQKRGFKVIFKFKEGNPYFPERELTKTYHLMQRPMEDEPEFDGIETVKPTWNEGKNLTRKTVTKTVKSKPKGKGKNKKPVTRKVTEEVPCPSFFNFFTAPEIPKDMSSIEEEEAAELQETLQMELEVGQILCEDVIPRAILFYMGAACGDDDDMGDFEDEDEDEDDVDDDDAEEDEDDEDEDEGDDDDDEDEEGAGDEKKSNDKPADGAKQETPEECKQQ